ncbi:MAG TPA: thioesterase family protein [Gemmatimonadales bacterium]|nr:thioesterase family protein [Gemmatimonadales bacterium]
MREHEIEVAVRPDDIDDLGHVNNIVYLRWVQEAATAHWRASAPVQAVDAVAWVVRRHEIDYRHPAMPNDRLVIRTWIGAAEGLTFERLTEILRARDGRVLAEARTLWIPIDARSGRPVRVSEEVRRRFSTP